MSDLNRVLATRRLQLVPLLPAHARRLFHHLQDARLYQFYPGEPPQSVKELTRHYEAWSTRTSPNGTQTWLNYAVRRVNGPYVGWVQATIARNTAQLGYVIFTPYWRKGYATEACRTLIQWLRRKHKVQRITAIVDSENTASIRLVEGLGFTLAWTGASEDMPGRLDRRYELDTASINLGSHERDIQMSRRVDPPRRA